MRSRTGCASSPSKQPPNYGEAARPRGSKSNGHPKETGPPGRHLVNFPTKASDDDNAAGKSVPSGRQAPERRARRAGGPVLEELTAERRWDELFAASPDLLDQLADEALLEHREGRTQPLKKL